MKKRILSLLLALCMIVGLLPAVAMPHAHADATTKTINVMSGGTGSFKITATKDGKTVSYTKNQKVELTDSDGNTLLDADGNPQTEWIQAPAEVTNEETDEWNAKFFYDTVDKKYKLIMKGVKVTRTCSYAFGAAYDASNYSIYIYITEDCYFDNGGSAIWSNQGATQGWYRTYITSENDATLYIHQDGRNGSQAGTRSSIHVMRGLILDANITITQEFTSKVNQYAIRAGGTTKTDDIITINGGNISIDNQQYSLGGAGYAAVQGDDGIVINGGVIEVTNNRTDTNGRGALYRAPDLSGYDGFFNMYIAKNGAPVHEFSQSKYFKIEAATEETHTHTYKTTITDKVDATCTENGSYVETITCTQCDAQISSETVIVEAAGHTVDEETGLCSVCGKDPTEAPACEHTNTTTKEETTKNPTCTEAGSKTVTVICADCGEPIGEPEIVAIDALNHKYGEWVDGKKTCSACGDVVTCECKDVTTETETKDATCTEDGSVTTTTTCKECGKVTTNVETIKSEGHTEAEAVTENFVDSDLNNKGSYESVVYCSVCDAELSRETVEVPVKDGAVAEIEGFKYATLQEAIDAAEAGETVTLLTDIDVASDLDNAAKGLYNVAADDKIIIDLNGKTINVTDNSKGNFIVFYNYGELTIKNGTVNLTSTYDRAFGAQSTIILNRGGKLVVESGTYEHKGGDSMAFVLDNSANSYGDAYMTIQGGTFKSTYTAIRMRMADPTLNGDPGNGACYLTIEDGEFYGAKRGIWGQITNASALELGALNITGGTIEGGDNAIRMTADGNDNIDVTISGNANIVGVLYGEAADFAISGGTFSVAVPEDLCAEGFIPTANEDGTFGVVEHTCSFTSETIDATCANPGKVIYTCTCGETYEEVIPATGEHEFDDDNDTTCNNCDYTRVVEITLTLDENNKLFFADPNADHIYHRVTVYYLDDKTVSDITLTNPLKAIDPNAKTYWGADMINGVELQKDGNYVVHLNYNTAGSPKYTLAKQFTVTAETASAPTIEMENNKLVVTDENANNIYHRVTVYYLGSETVSNIYDVNALKAVDAEAKTYWGMTEINKVLLAKSGNYVVHLNYNNPGSDKITVAEQFTVVASKPSISRDGYKLKVTDNDATHKYHRATVYYVGSATVDIYDEAALKAINPTAKTYWGLSAINKVEMATPGTYVIYLSYNLENGVKQTMVVKTTTRMPVPSVWLEENGQIGTYVPTEVAHRNYEIYYLGDQTVEDIYDIDALKAIDPDPIKFDNQKQIAERGILTEVGNYVLVMYYNYAGSARQVVATFATLNK